MITERDVAKAINPGTNMEWCKPIHFEAADIFFLIEGGKITGIRSRGNDVKVSPECLNHLAKKLNDRYDDYVGSDDTHILLAAEHEELGCDECPWNDVCDLMDREVECPYDTLNIAQQNKESAEWYGVKFDEDEDRKFYCDYHCKYRDICKSAESKG